MLGTMGKVIFFLFLINMGLYVSSNFLGYDNFLLLENDLFHSMVQPTGNGFSQGKVYENISSVNDPTSVDQTGVQTILNLFDPLVNFFRLGFLGLKTIINIFATPFTLMNALVGGDINMPPVIVIMLIAPMTILLVIGFISLLRGKDI